MQLLFNSNNLSRRTTSPTVSLLKISNNKKSNNRSTYHPCRLAPNMTRKTNCRSRPKPAHFFIIILVCGWAVCLTYLIFGPDNIIKRRMRILTQDSTSSKSSPIYIKNDPKLYDPNYKEPIFTNIGIVIPAYVNEYTVQYLERILHNIYLSQIDFDDENNDNNANNDNDDNILNDDNNNYGNKLNKNHIYYPSEVIISMSIMPEFYKYENNLTNTLNLYIKKYLNNDKSRLKMIYHYNKTMNAAQNRNFGILQIDETRSEYIGMFDIDDIMHPQRTSILYHILNGNKNEIDFIFHAFIMHKGCKDKQINVDYLKNFRSYNANFINDKGLKLLTNTIQNEKYYAKSYCVATYKKKNPEKPELAVFKVLCDNEEHKRSLYALRKEYDEFIVFDRFYHHTFNDVNFINYSQLIDRRCNDKEFVLHPISKQGLKEVDCSYGTMAGGIEAFRNQQAVTRHHNGWPTLKTSIAKQIKYDEDWEMHGSYRGQDAAFNREVHRNGYNVYHTGYYLGLYCYH